MLFDSCTTEIHKLQTANCGLWTDTCRLLLHPVQAERFARRNVAVAVDRGTHHEAAGEEVIVGESHELAQGLVEIGGGGQISGPAGADAACGGGHFQVRECRRAILFEPVVVGRTVGGNQIRGRTQHKIGAALPLADELGQNVECAEGVDDALGDGVDLFRAAGDGPLDELRVRGGGCAAGHVEQLEDGGFVECAGLEGADGAAGFQQSIHSRGRDLFARDGLKGNVVKLVMGKRLAHADGHAMAAENALAARILLGESEIVGKENFGGANVDAGAVLFAECGINRNGGHKRAELLACANGKRIRGEGGFFELVAGYSVRFEDAGWRWQGWNLLFENRWQRRGIAGESVMRMRDWMVVPGLAFGLLASVGARAQMPLPGMNDEVEGPVVNPLTDPTMTAGKAELLELEAKFAADVAKRGGKGFAEWFAEDGVVLSNGQAPVEGRVAIERSSRWLPQQYELTWTPTAELMGPSGDMGYTWGHYEGVSRDSHGHERKTSGRYLTVWRKDLRGEWKVVLETGSEEPAESGDCCRVAR